MKETRGERGNDPGAHRGCSGRRSGLGDALETANSTAMMVGARRGERRRGGDAGLPGSCGAVGRKRGSRRSLWASRGSEGWPVSAAMVNGGDGGVRPWERESEEEEGRTAGE